MRCFDCLKQCDDKERGKWFIGMNINGVNRVDVPRCPECYNKEVKRK